MKKLQLNEKIELGLDEYFVFEDWRSQATTITTKVLLSYLKWRKDNNIYTLNNYMMPDKFKKCKIKYGTLYIKQIQSKMFDYTATIMFVFRTKSGVTVWKLPIKGNLNTWNRVRYAINKYGKITEHGV